MFHFDGGLKLTRADLAIDFTRRQPRAFISHAHADHMAPHQYALCTPATARLYQLRHGPRDILELPYRQRREWGGLTLSTWPAGHCLGSAMLLAEDGDRSLLYTGDFKLGRSATAESADLPRADVLVIECTYGRPQYRLPPREETIAELVRLVRRALEADATPVIQAYVLGKAQEVTRILTLAGIPVLSHPKVHQVSQVYRACGVELGDAKPYQGDALPGHALIVPPRTHRPGQLEGIRRAVRFAVTGWALDPGCRRRLGVDHALPLSDHADYDELFAAVERVQPREVYCTHGPESFAERLAEAGYQAHPLGRPRQGRLF